jgi:glucan phosphoethanolaminetransferase (alkaline phosphatase superfamily)
MYHLANADANDTTNASIAVLVISSGIFVLAIGAAMFPICIVWKRRIRQADVVVPLCILWALLAAAVSIYAYVSQTRWTTEYTLRIASGYFDPRDTSDRPSLPWLLWYILAMLYVLLVMWVARTRHRQPDSPSPVIKH